MCKGNEYNNKCGCLSYEELYIKHNVTVVFIGYYLVAKLKEDGELSYKRREKCLRNKERFSKIYLKFRAKEGNRRETLYAYTQKD